MLRLATILSLIPLLVSCATAGSIQPATPDVRIEVDTAEAEAVLRIAEEQAAGGKVNEESWAALVATNGYRDLKRREDGMGRSFTDDEFRAFATSESVVARRGALRKTLAAWSRADLQAGAERALRYLPAGAKIETVVYPLIKPKPNSFVSRTERGRAIFLYLDPEVSGANATEDVPQGAFYTVGWHMASKIEQARGRDAMVAVICDAPAVMALYNEVVSGSEEPQWSDGLLAELGIPHPGAGGTPAPHEGALRSGR